MPPALPIASELRAESRQSRAVAFALVACRLIAASIAISVIAPDRVANAADALAFHETFESLQPGLSVHGQAQWFVQPVQLTNTAMVVKQQSVACTGSQYLAVRGGKDPGDAVVARVVFGGIALDAPNSVFRYHVRFDRSGRNGLTTYWDGNDGPFQIVRTEFDSAGAGRYYTGNGTTPVAMGVSLDTGVWYEVSCRAFPTNNTVRLTLKASGRDAALFDQVIPMNSTGTVTASYGFEFKVDADPGNDWLIDDVSLGAQ